MNNMKRHITDTLARSVAAWAAANGVATDAVPAVALTVPKEKAHGDYAASIALPLGKQAGCNPRALAGELCASVGAALDGLATCEVAGPGFINFRLSADAGKTLFDGLLRQGDRLGYADVYKGRRVNVEYVSANPTGPLTVGHGRNAAIGDVVANLHAALGAEVTREYYFNDAGNQMNVLARSVRTRYRQLLGCADELEEGGYQGDYIYEIARKIQLDHGEAVRDSEDLGLFKQYAVEATFAMIRATLERMRVRHDIYFNEHSLYTDGRIKETLDAIADMGLSYEADGAVWFKATKFGAEKDRVLVKSSGEPTYRVPDIAYHRDKFGRGFDLMIDVFGADHMATYPDVLACVQALGYDAERVRVLIHQFVTVVQHGQVVKMSTRKANYVTLDELMDDVGVDATRYFFVMRRLGSHFEFDLDLARAQSLDNPVFYVQYGHARVCSIFRHCAEQKPHIEPAALTPESADGALLAAAEEQELLRHCALFPETVHDTADACEPHRLTGYLERLAELFHRYYNQHQIVVEDDDLARARLALVRIVRVILRNGLDLLGVTAPERM
jgi:arginyl-tRNA synthetase